MPSRVVRDFTSDAASSRLTVYDTGSSRLSVTFVSGRVSVYEDAPPKGAADFSLRRL